jgi:hypothetical protein
MRGSRVTDPPYQYMQMSGQLVAVTLFKLVATESVFSLELEVRLKGRKKIFCPSRDLNPSYPIFQSVVYKVVKSKIQHSFL